MKLLFKDPKTNRTFTAIKTADGWLVPIWVKTPPKQWIRVGQS